MDVQQRSTSHRALTRRPIVEAEETSNEETFLFVDNWSPATSGSQRGKQGGSRVVRSHVSKRSKRGKREQKVLGGISSDNLRNTSLGPQGSSSECIASGQNFQSPRVWDIALREQSAIGFNHERQPPYPSSKQRTMPVEHSNQQQNLDELSEEPEINTTEYWQARSNAPVNIEYLGGWKIDPFGTFPLSNASVHMHDLVDHSIFEITPRVIPDLKVRQALRGLTLICPALFHVLVYAGYVHQNMLKTGVLDIEAPMALYHKVLAIQELAKMVTDPKRVIKDDVIYTIVTLGLHEGMSMLQLESSPFDSPLRTGQALHIYGRIEKSNLHLKALDKVMALRGGLESCGFFANLWFIILIDTITSTNSMSPPYFPGFRFIKHKIDRIRVWSQVYRTSSLPRHGVGFVQYQENGIHPHMMYLIESIAALTTLIHSYLEGKAENITLQDILDGRTAIQNTILSLPPHSELQEAPLRSISIYEPCRLAILIYGIAVVFPLPNPWNALQKLVTEIKVSLENTPMLYYQANAELLLWMLLLGGIAALGKQERTWYVAQLAVYSERYQVIQWEDVEGSMHSFLWLSSACRRPGMALWSEVNEQSRLSAR